MNQTLLILEDGTVFKGCSREPAKRIFGEIVFNTSMTGYTEIFTDPSYAGQILLMTYPLIGNYGIYKNNYESNRIQIRGLITKSPYFFAHRGTPLHRFLNQTNLMCLFNIDTRSLTLRIRRYGTMKAMLVHDALKKEKIQTIIKQIQHLPHPDNDNLVAAVSCKRIIHYNTGRRKRIVVIDCGVKKSIIKYLKTKAHVIQVPYDTTTQTIEKMNAHGIVLSNGPGDPAHPSLQKTTIQTIRSLLGKYRMFGICLGHQLLGIALGMRTFKLKFGHRGSNHAAIHLESGRVYITAQNHGYALRKTSSSDIRITWLNANDGTVEGFRHTTLPVSAVQFHPEASPGPHDTQYLFKQYLDGIYASK